MSSFRIRPRFDMYSQKTVEEVIELIKEKLKDNPHNLYGVAMQDHITIRVDSEKRHFWSPQLSVLLQREEGDTETKIIGVYGPMPSVWTMFAFGYLAIGVLFVFISIVGFSQRALGSESSILWSLPFMMIVAIIMYIISQMGQKLAAAQTYAIHYFFQDALGETIPEV